MPRAKFVDFNWPKLITKRGLDRVKWRKLSRCKDRLANSKVKTVCLTLETYLGKHKHSLFTRQHRDAKGKKTFDLQGSWKIGHGSTQVGHKQHVGKKRFQHTHACTRLLLQVAVHNTVLAAQNRARALSASASGTPGATGTRSAEP